MKTKTKTKEFFIVTNSFAAPFFSDTSEYFVKATTAKAALEKKAKNYKHPCGLYAAVAYESAEAYHKNRKPLAKWLCNKEQMKEKVTKGLGAYSYRGIDDHRFEIDGKEFYVEDPKGGSVI